MSACSFDRLLLFVNKRLDPDGQLAVHDHLDRCEICRDAVYQLSRDRASVSRLSRAPCGSRHCAAPYAAAGASPGAAR